MATIPADKPEWYLKKAIIEILPNHPTKAIIYKEISGKISVIEMMDLLIGLNKTFGKAAVEEYKKETKQKIVNTILFEEWLENKRNKLKIRSYSSKNNT